ncbi:phosphonate C-P lyase system protein PhnH [Undibacterium sp. TJN19]|uniref:phosphonate C-P lyase system protein PhnH n=1 Tax=Undibacterium sp. TJN19 TaxID=3413055 RepID=UPI003BEF55E7
MNNVEAINTIDTVNAMNNPVVGQGLLPAWNDAVHDAQTVFRSLLKALSEPGSIQRLSVQLQAPAPLHLATAAACLALMDFETSTWLAPDLDNEAVRAYLRFHCGLPLVTDKTLANFVVLNAPLQNLDLQEYAQGSMTYPDKSATLLIQVDDLENGPENLITGPGIKESGNFRVAGLPADFVSRWQQNNLGFPQGVDIIFCCRDALLGLPRTSRIEKKDNACTSQ